MIRHILKQIWTQRRRNTWILTELFIVLVLSWYIIDFGFVLTHNNLITNGFKIDNTYRVYYKELSKEIDKKEFRSFYDKVRLFPGVKKTFLTAKYSGVTPYNGSMSGTNVKRDTTKTSKEFFAQTKPLTTNNYFDIFQVYSTLTPNKPGQLDFSKKSAVLTKNLADAMFKDESPVGKRVFMNGKEEYVVVDIVNNQKRFTYDQPGNLMFFPINDSTITQPEIAIQVGDNFSLEKFKKEVNNTIISYDDVRKKQEMMGESTIGIRISLGIMIFFLLNIALGVIGTFWFRNQTRRGEIGLRIAMGSSKIKLQAQYIFEAILLLTLAFIPALCVNAALVHYDIITTTGETIKESGYITAYKWLRFLITSGITYILLAAIVALSAWIPANRASRVHPVDALRDE